MGGGVVEEEKKQHAMNHVRTVLNAAEIADLKQYHDNSLAENSKKAYQSDYDSFVDFLSDVQNRSCEKIDVR